MEKRYYFDTSIWIDFFENRDEPNLPKAKYVKELIAKIVADDDRIIITELIAAEMRILGYNEFEIESLLKPYEKVLIKEESTKKHHGKAKDLSAKRDIPVVDAMHALIARDFRAILVTRDNHFKKLADIIKTKKPEELI